MNQVTLNARAVELGTRLSGVDLSLEHGQCVVLTGPNGSGKSSLVRTLLGLERPSQGSIELNGRKLSNWTRAHLAAHVAWLPQRPALGEHRLTEELVAAARFRFRESAATSRRHALAALEAMQVEHLAGRRTDRISGGELQRVLLATLVAQEAPLLLVDEPANHLDPRQQISAYRALGDLWRAGHGLLVVSHEMGLARLLGDAGQIRVLGLDAGRVAFEEQLAARTLPGALERLSGIPYRTGIRAGDVSIDWESIE